VDPLDVDIGPERDRRSIVELLADRVLDADLAALAWLLLEKRAPIVVAAGPSGTGKTVLLRALLAFLPPDAVVQTIAGAWERWDWLPPATRAELGVLVMPRDGPPRGPQVELDADDAVLVVPEFSQHLPIYGWGPVARTAIRLASMGYGLAATVHAESLADVFDELGGPGVGATADELSALGLVLVMAAVDRRLDPGGRRRVVAAHYVRPLARDVHGHVQRLDPAVLATWDPATDTWEDFSWGVLPELAPRLVMRAGDLEAERDRRSAYLRALVAAGLRDERAAVAAIRSYGRPAARA
jgi:hypothetical protein